MSYARPAKVDPNHLQSNGKLYSDEMIAEITKSLEKQARGNRFVPRIKLNKPGTLTKQPFSVTRMDGELYAIYYGKKQGKHLGEGAFGKVKLAQNLKTGEWVALKMTRVHSASLESEVAINQMLGTAHSSLHVRPDKSRKNGFKFEFMISLARGEEMANIFVAENNPNAKSIPLHERMRAAIQVVSEFERMHQNGVLHCDIKLENMFYDKQTNKVTIIDFGLSKVMDENGTAAASFRGSPFSIPPEIIYGSQTNVFSVKTDTFGVGVALADIFGFTLRPNPLSIQTSHLHRNADYLPIKPKNFDDHIEKEIITLINRMISQDPSQRPSLSQIAAGLSKIQLPDLGIEQTMVVNQLPPPANEMSSAMLTEMLRRNLLEMTSTEYNRITDHGGKVPVGDRKIQALSSLIAALKDDKVPINEISRYAHDYKQASLAKQTAASRLFHKSSKADKFLAQFEKMFAADIRKIMLAQEREQSPQQLNPTRRGG